MNDFAMNPQDLAWDAVCGRARRTCDLVLPQMLHGTILASPQAHARLTAPDLKRARQMPGVRAALACADTPMLPAPGPGLASSSQLDPRPLAWDECLWRGQPVVCLAADSAREAAKALESVRLELEELPAVLGAELALEPDAPQVAAEVAPGNLALAHKVEQGDVGGAMAAAHLVRQDVFVLADPGATPAEPVCALAAPLGAGRLVVHSSTATPNRVAWQLAEVLGIDPRRLRVENPGGPGVTQGLMPHEFAAAVLCLKTGRPVRVAPDAAQLAAWGGWRGPEILIRLQTAFDAQGGMLGREVELLASCGAANCLGQGVVRMAGVWAALPYRLPAYRYRGAHVLTHQPPSGPGLGWGAAQVCWASEAHLSLAAAELGLDPVELRRKNALTLGDQVPGVGRLGGEALAECLAGLPGAGPLACAASAAGPDLDVLRAWGEAERHLTLEFAAARVVAQADLQTGQLALEALEGVWRGGDQDPQALAQSALGAWHAPSALPALAGANAPGALAWALTSALAETGAALWGGRPALPVFGPQDWLAAAGRLR